MGIIRTPFSYGCQKAQCINMHQVFRWPLLYSKCSGIVTQKWLLLWRGMIGHPSSEVLKRKRLIFIIGFVFSSLWCRRPVATSINYLRHGLHIGIRVDTEGQTSEMNAALCLGRKNEDIFGCFSKGGKQWFFTCFKATLKNIVCCSAKPWSAVFLHSDRYLYTWNLRNSELCSNREAPTSKPRTQF